MTTWQPLYRRPHALTTENFPSPNHMTHLVPSAARLRPVIHQDTMRPGHHENPRSFPQTNSPMPKPRPSSCQSGAQNNIAGGASRSWRSNARLKWRLKVSLIDLTYIEVYEQSVGTCETSPTSYSGSVSAVLGDVLSPPAMATGSGVVATVGEAGSVGCCCCCCCCWGGGGGGGGAGGCWWGCCCCCDCCWYWGCCGWLCDWVGGGGSCCCCCCLEGDGCLIIESSSRWHSRLWSSRSFMVLPVDISLAFFSAWNERTELFRESGRKGFHRSFLKYYVANE